MAVVHLVVLNDPEDPEAIDVWVDGLIGDDRVRFKLDSGAADCVVPSMDATSRLPTTGVNQGFGGSGVAMGGDDIVLPQIRLGDVLVENVAATRTPSDVTLPSLIGQSLLARFDCDFRFSERRLGLDDRTDDEVSGWFELARHTGGQPILTVDFEGVSTTAVWDTGAGLTAVDVSFAEAHPHLFEPIRSAVGFDAGGIEIPSQLAHMAPCKIGGVSFDASVCALVDFGPMNDRLEEPIHVILGMPVIIQADWRFDAPQRRWSLRRPRPLD
jgi:Aspartyl protease